MTIANTTKVLTELAGLLLAGLVLKEAIDKVADEFGLTKKQVKRIWKNNKPALPWG